MAHNIVNSGEKCPVDPTHFMIVQTGGHPYCYNCHTGKSGDPYGFGQRSQYAPPEVSLTGGQGVDSRVEITSLNNTDFLVPDLDSTE